MRQREFKRHLWNQGFDADYFTFTRTKGFIVVCYRDKVITITKKLEQDTMNEILEFFKENDMYTIRFMDQDDLILIFGDKVINFDSLIQIDHRIKAREEICERLFKYRRYGYFRKDAKSEIEEILVRQGYWAYKE